MSTRSRSLVAAVAAAGLLLAGCSTQTAGTAQLPAAAASGAVVGSSSGNAGAPAIDTPSAPSEPALSEPALSEPALSEPALSEPALSEPALSEPALSEPALSEPALSEPAPSEPAPSEPAPSEPAPSGSTGAQSGGDAVDPQTFAKELQAGMSKVSSVTGSLSEDTAFGATAKLRETVRGGKSAAIDLTGIPTNEPDNGFSLRSVGGKGYLASPIIISMMSDKAAGKTWVLVNPDVHDSAAASMSDLLGPELQLANVGAYLDIAQAARTVSAQGPEKVGSMATTKYQADIDASKLASVLPPELKEIPARTDAIGAKSVSVTYWLDSQNRLVKVLVDSHHPDGDSTVTLTVSAFNVPLTIEAPAASTVYTG